MENTIGYGYLGLIGASFITKIPATFQPITRWARLTYGWDDCKKGGPVSYYYKYYKTRTVLKFGCSYLEGPLSKYSFRNLTGF